MINIIYKTMGCSNPKENLVDQIMVLKLKRIVIQMEREKNLKILSEIEGRNIDDNNLPEYLASRNVKQSQNININYDEENNEVPNEIKNENNNVVNVSQEINQGSIKDCELEENKNEYNLSLNDNNKANNIVNQNIDQPLTINSQISKKRIIRKKKRKISSQTVNNNENINNHDINKL